MKSILNIIVIIGALIGQGILLYKLGQIHERINQARDEAQATLDKAEEYTAK